MSTAVAAAPKKVRAAKRKTTPSKDAAPKAKRGDGQRVSNLTPIIRTTMQPTALVVSAGLGPFCPPFSGDRTSS